MDPVAAHGCHLLQQLQEQRVQGLLCDCMLVVRGVCFKAHKNVLAAFSHYFRSLFQNASGQRSDVFHLDLKNVNGIGQILDFMYTSRLDLSRDNVHVMVDIARCLQVQNALSLCQAFLKSAVPVAKEPAPSLPCRGAASPPSTLTPGAPCVLSESFPPHPLQEGPPDTPRNAEGGAPKQAPGSLDGSSSAELPRKQPSYCYKLRTLYSKQHCRQSSGPDPEHPGEPPLPLPLPAAPAPGQAECSLDIPKHPPSHFVSRPPSPAALGPEPPKPMRLKKAAHLEALSFLKSQQPAELPASKPASMPGPERRVAQRTASAHGGTQPHAGSPSPLENEREELASSENSGCGHEAGRPDGPADVEDPSQALQPQRQYACELCRKPFKHPSNLELHKRSHTGEKPFECHVCGRHFSQAGNLQTHLRRHSGEKPYICEVCGKRFAASGDVQRHIIIHSGEKPHLCDICGRGFSNFSNLKEHKKTHTADELFTCHECGKSFNMQRKLVKHRVRHTGQRPYSCAACGKSFGGSGDLRRHLRTHTGEKPYTCEICSKCFTRAAVLRRHRRMHSRTCDSQPAPTAKPPPPCAEAPAAAEFGRPAAGSHCKLRASVPPTGAGHTQESSVGTGKLAKSQMPPAHAYADMEAAQPVPADGASITRSSLAAPDSHCGDSLGARASEGQFFSSMTLWGLAMKTLQNEGELDQ
ncbi:zinc finger and BTB domain-containing protein 49 [Tenrec ecaudatus]|uniref:zinc finger and BTB domain-containing protein 49 n=1 Tax=Tenrec ecaudatus TaxID=94439 RepID=UPI003F5A3678